MSTLFQTSLRFSSMSSPGLMTAISRLLSALSPSQFGEAVVFMQAMVEIQMFRIFSSCTWSASRPYAKGWAWPYIGTFEDLPTRPRG